MIFLLICVLLFVAELVYFKIADRFNIIDKPNQRSSHTSVTLRGGGIIFLIGMLLYAAFFGFTYPWFTLGLVLICGISFADDVKPLSSNLRLVFHFSAMLLMFLQWGLFSQFPLWYIPIALIFCTGIINAYNFMDGINGITGGYSLVVLSGLAYINQFIVSFVDPMLLYVAIASVLVFNFFNFRKKAKCFAGDVGSVGIAFIVLFALGSLILKTEDVSYIMLLAVYGVDAVLTIVHRIMLKEKLTEPHRKHAYQLMVNELRIPHVYVSALYMLLQAVIIAGFVVSNEYKWFYLIGVLSILSSSYVWFKRKYFHLHLQA